MKIIPLLVIFFFSIVSCTTSPVTPNQASRQTIDSLYQHKTLALQHGMDSMCEVNHQKHFSAMVDSIMSSRQSEMINLVK